MKKQKYKMIYVFKCSLDEQQCGEECHGNRELKLKCEFCKVSKKRKYLTP